MVKNFCSEPPPDALSPPGAGEDGLLQAATESTSSAEDKMFSIFFNTNIPPYAFCNRLQSLLKANGVPTDTHAETQRNFAVFLPPPIKKNRQKNPVHAEFFAGSPNFPVF
jgi:hypothetical protein